jgi:hypothetical protein
VILNFIGVSVTYNFQPRNNKIKLLMKYKSVTQKVLFDNAVLPAMISGRKYVISQNGDCSRESNMLSFIKIRHYRTQYGKAPPSDNAI